MQLIYFVLAIIAGFAAATQSGVNAQLRTHLGNPYLTALISFASGTGLLLILYWFNKGGVAASTTGKISWYQCTGGVLGVIFVTIILNIAHQVGATTMFSFIIAGQLLAAILFDHFGLLGYQSHPVSLWRIAGILLVVVGAIIILKN